MKLSVVVGARPQFIKAAPLFRALAKHNVRNPESAISADLVHTGQHYDRQMSDVFFEQGALPEPLELGIAGGGNASMTARMLEALNAEFERSLPDAVLVFGDTNSTLAAALAAADLCIPVIHVEAGLRSGDLTMPEERNRIIADRLSSVHFCPALGAMENLRAEGIVGEYLLRDELPEPDSVVCFGGDCIVMDSGDIMMDALLHDVERVPELPSELMQKVPARPYAVCTLHRAASVDDRIALSVLLEGIGLVARDMQVLLPVHPRLQARLDAFGLSLPECVVPVEPLGHNEFLAVLRDCAGVLTDSGGLQKEAAFLGKPCVVLRPGTEWHELVQRGACVLACSDATAPGDVLRAWLKAQESCGGPVRIYGDGRAAERMVAAISSLRFR